MICASCGADNESGRKFCLECGTSLAAACPACGSPNPPAARFCGECGARLAGGAAPAHPVQAPAPPVAERRVDPPAGGQERLFSGWRTLATLLGTGDAQVRAAVTESRQLFEKMGAGLWLGLLDATEARGALVPNARSAVKQLTVPAEHG